MRTTEVIEAEINVERWLDYITNMVEFIRVPAYNPHYMNSIIATWSVKIGTMFLDCHINEREPDELSTLVYDYDKKFDGTLDECKQKIFEMLNFKTYNPNH